MHRYLFCNDTSTTLELRQANCRITCKAQKEIFVAECKRLVYNTSQAIVVRKDANPLIGYWKEQSQLTCDGFTEVAPEGPIREFQFKADGKFYVTWMPSKFITIIGVLILMT
jgi:hypothetical protein